MGGLGGMADDSGPTYAVPVGQGVSRLLIVNASEVDFLHNE